MFHSRFFPPDGILCHHLKADVCVGSFLFVCFVFFHLNFIVLQRLFVTYCRKLLLNNAINVSWCTFIKFEYSIRIAPMNDMRREACDKLNCDNL